MNSLRKYAAIAGLSYLIIILTGIFANFFVLENLVVPGNASVTAENISANEMLFRVGIFSFLIMVIFDVAAAWALYLFLKPVNKNLSLLAAWFRLINAAVFGFALFYLLIVLKFLDGAGYLTALDAVNLKSTVILALDSFNFAWLIGLVFFGIHLSLLGYLIFKSSYIPKFLGILLIAASLGYLIDGTANILLHNYTDYKDIFTLIVAVPGVIGEFSFCFWLLFKGSKQSEIKPVE
jgi:Domain of unknown function (DUF4386)